MTRSRRNAPLRALASLAAAAALAAAPASASAVDPVLTYSGYLRTASGAPETGATTLTFRLHGAESGGVPLWEESIVVTPGADGWFSAVLGATAPLPAGLFSGPLWLGLQAAADASEMTPRVRLTPAPSAVAVDWSGVANKPASFPSDWDDVASKPSSFPAAWSDVTGKPATFPSAWADLTGKPATFPVDTGTVQARIAGSCAPGQYVRAVGQDGSVTCGVDANAGGTVTAVTGSGPLMVTNGTTTPAIAIAQANATTGGYLTGTKFAEFDAKLGPGAPAGGDLSGALPSPTVVRIQGRPVGAEVPTTGATLRWDGTAWRPASLALGCAALYSTVTVPAGAVNSVTVSCPGNYAATGGSADVDGGSPIAGVWLSSTPEGNGWRGVANNQSGFAFMLRAWVQCCRVQ